jgi:DNA polymerase/3'-5' exonuclease PolX
MNRIEADDLPMYIHEVYLFGSFLRSKEYPKDIDILLIYDSDKTAELYEVRSPTGEIKWRIWEMRRSPARLRGVLKANSERSVDINICPTLKAFQMDLAYEMDTWLKIWDREDDNWRAKLLRHFDDLS